MRRNSRTHSLSMAFVLVCLFAPAMAGDDGKPVRIVDPLTGKVTIQAAPEPDAPAQAETADLSKANRLIKKQDFAGAETILAPMLAEYPDDPALHLLLGEVRIAMKKPAEALPPLERAAELAPHKERVQFQLGSALISTGKAEDALEAFDREIENTDDKQILALSQMNKAFILQKMKKWEEAAEAYEKAAELDPSHPQVYADAASLYLQARNPEKAEAALAAGAKNGFHSAQHYYSLGAGFYKKNQYDKAIEAYRLCLGTNPKYARAERGIGLSLEKKGQNQEAVEHYRKYLELKPDARDKDKVLAEIKTISGS